MSNLLFLVITIALFPTIIFFLYEKMANLSTQKIYIKSIIFIIICILQMGTSFYITNGTFNPFRLKIEKQEKTNTESEMTTHLNNKELILQSPKDKNKADSHTHKDYQEGKEKQENKIISVILTGLSILVVFIYLFRQFKKLLFELNDVDESSVNYSIGLWSLPILIIGSILYLFLFQDSKDLNENYKILYLLFFILLFIISHVIQIYSIVKYSVHQKKLLFIRLSVFYIGYVYVCIFGAAFLYLFILLIIILFLMLLIPRTRYYIRY